MPSLNGSLPSEYEVANIHSNPSYEKHLGVPAQELLATMHLAHKQHSEGLGLQTDGNQAR
jgi:hypothetical protein